MFKFLKFGCLGLIGLVVLLTVIGFITENINTKTEENTKEVMLDASQFSMISSDELVKIMGEPQEISDYEWSIPKTGESVVGKLYIYENNKYEFVLFDDVVARLNVYSGTFMGYDNTSFSFEDEQNIFSMFNITPNANLKKIVDNNLTLRFSPVSEKVADVWIEGIENNKFETAKITYNLNFY